MKREKDISFDMYIFSGTFATIQFVTIYICPRMCNGIMHVFLSCISINLLRLEFAVSS